MYVLPESELLVTFKLLQPLTRVDRCTGRNYSDLHIRQSDVLVSSNRFKRNQRLHTSDGDKAQSLAERTAEARQALHECYTVPTYRTQCSVHRVYHIMTAGMVLFSNFIAGQIRMALPLRGPRNFKKFKEFLWRWLLASFEYVFEEDPVGPGPAADDNRKRVFDVFSPVIRGRHQRRNRLKCWIVRKSANGDIRKRNCFQH